jgi:hypothetical protein
MDLLWPEVDAKAAANDHLGHAQRHA